MTPRFPRPPPSKQSFPMRDAVMSGYAAATVVVSVTPRPLTFRLLRVLRTGKSRLDLLSRL